MEEVTMRDFLEQLIDINTGLEDIVSELDNIGKALIALQQELGDK